MPPATKNIFAALVDNSDSEEDVEEEEVEAEPEEEEVTVAAEEVVETPPTASKGKGGKPTIVQAKTVASPEPAAAAKPTRASWADESDSEQSPGKAQSSPKEKRNKAKKPAAMGKNKFAMLMGDEDSEESD
mmetsp:Transcript_55733/g.161455  ORF Transcript_55733/g.161455 Transcript_55733/m.161455 type:complete len:131 (-) Transcript_55733:125-517(-)|eukprot:CAMPEP_0176066854 /NCGR_PEP_ID=MMETSP0120_2-20121206/33365_1 /TAXON_ID=160619 /ORGANISM="Kryptoperidinium foliaceum, Strain CCMP 1326" /LENGTH=130 /DNA_ID=CAMNT_0017400463 /DNA_START=63 /DNA_END=455 /DNA_ORIENTATION=-